MTNAGRQRARKGGEVNTQSDIMKCTPVSNRCSTRGFIMRSTTPTLSSRAVIRAFKAPGGQAQPSVATSKVPGGLQPAPPGTIDITGSFALAPAFTAIAPGGRSRLTVPEGTRKISAIDIAQAGIKSLAVSHIAPGDQGQPLSVPAGTAIADKEQTQSPPPTPTSRFKLTSILRGGTQNAPAGPSCRQAPLTAAATGFQALTSILRGGTPTAPTGSSIQPVTLAHKVARGTVLLSPRKETIDPSPCLLNDSPTREPSSWLILNREQIEPTVGLSLQPHETTSSGKR